MSLDAELREAENRLSQGRDWARLKTYYGRERVALSAMAAMTFRRSLGPSVWNSVARSCCSLSSFFKYLFPLGEE